MRGNAHALSGTLILVLLVGCLGAGRMSGQTAMKFVHPGAVTGKADLEFVKAKIKAGEEPWAGAFRKMERMATGGTHALVHVDSSDHEEVDISKTEAKKAYANALAWYFTGKKIHARQALAVLNAWAGFQGFNAGSDQDKLQAGWIGDLKVEESKWFLLLPGIGWRGATDRRGR